MRYHRPRARERSPTTTAPPASLRIIDRSTVRSPVGCREHLRANDDGGWRPTRRREHDHATSSTHDRNRPRASESHRSDRHRADVLERYRSGIRRHARHPERRVLRRRSVTWLKRRASTRRSPSARTSGSPVAPTAFPPTTGGTGSTTSSNSPASPRRATNLVQFPLLFASTAFVPERALPGWLRAVSSANPVTYGADATRTITLSGWEWGRHRPVARRARRARFTARRGGRVLPRSSVEFGRSVDGRRRRIGRFVVSSADSAGTLRRPLRNVERVRLNGQRVRPRLRRHGNVD